MTTIATPPQRYARFADIVPLDRIAKFTPTIIGCGAIGSLVARQLAQMGSSMHLYDFDTVDEVNLACQGFEEGDLGMPKVEALKRTLTRANSEIQVTANNRKYTMSATEDSPSEVIICCVDSIRTRGLIYKWLNNQFEFFVDGRMKGGDTIRIVQARSSNIDSMLHYPTTIFDPSEAAQGACTAKTTIYGAYVAAGLMVSEYAKWLRGYGYFEKDYLLSLPAIEIGAV